MSVIRAVASPLAYQTDIAFNKGDKDFLISANITAQDGVIRISANNIAIDRHVIIAAKALIISCREAFVCLGTLNAPAITIEAPIAYLTGTLVEGAVVVSDIEPCKNESLATEIFGIIAGQFESPGK